MFITSPSSLLLLSLPSFFTIVSSASSTILEGYWAQTTYEGVTCGNLIGNEAFITDQSGVRFGVCQVGYDAYGVAVSSVMYTLDCGLIVNDDFQGTKVVYADTKCSSKPISTTTWTPSATCSTFGVQTISYTCSYGNTKPYKSLSKGYIVGQSSTPEHCENKDPYVWSWTQVKACELPTSTTVDYTSSKHTCSDSTTSSTDYYYDKTCSSSFLTQTSSFVACSQIYSSSATQTNPSLTSFKFGICQSSSGSPSTSTSSSDDDEVSFTESEYGGAVTGTLLCGILIGLILTSLILVFCCGYHSSGSKDSNNNCSNHNSNSGEPSNQPKSSLTQPIFEEKNDA